MLNNNNRGSNYCVSFHVVTVAATLLIHAAVAEAIWHVKFGMPPSSNNIQPPAVEIMNENISPSTRFDPNTLPMFMNPPYIFGSPKHFPLQKRMSEDVLNSDADGFADSLETNIGMGKRSGGYRHFGRDSTSLRFGKRAFARPFL